MNIHKIFSNWIFVKWCRYYMAEILILLWVWDWCYWVYYLLMMDITYVQRDLSYWWGVRLNNIPALSIPAQWYATRDKIYYINVSKCASYWGLKNGISRKLFHKHGTEKIRSPRNLEMFSYCSDVPDVFWLVLSSWTIKLG